MTKVIIDNSTLTAVQRLLGDITIKNKSVIDGDILALENLLQCILLYDEIKFVDDYKENHKISRDKRFGFISKAKIDNENYQRLISLARKHQDTISIEKGEFKGKIETLMKDLKMHMAFTWDMQSSEYFLWAKMLKGPESSSEEEEHFKYKLASLMNQYMPNSNSSELNNLNLRTSNETPLKKNPYLKEKSNYTEDKIFSDQTQLLLNSLSWISLRTYFYLMLAQKEEADLFLHPIRSAFHLDTLLSRDSEIKLSDVIKNMLNDTVQNTYNRITKNINFTGEVFNLPIFSAWIINKVSDPQQVLPYALDLKSKKEFKRLRFLLFNLREEDFPIKKVNKLISDIKYSLKKIEREYCMETHQGSLCSSIGLLINTICGNILPLLEEAGSIFEKQLKERKVGHLFRSITKDLLSISKMGGLHEKLTSNVKLHKDADEQYVRKEESRFFGKSSFWKKPM